MNIRASNSVLVSLLFMVSCSVASDLDSKVWLEKHLSKSEELYCWIESDDDYFFVSRDKAWEVGKVKTGYLIKVSSNSDAPLGYTAGWRFQDSNGGYVETQQSPSPISGGYLIVEDDTYSEQVEYHYLHLRSVTELTMTMELGKFDGSKKATEKPKTEEVGICKVKIVAKAGLEGGGDG